jgi:hypothetical protein
MIGTLINEVAQWVAIAVLLVLAIRIARWADAADSRDHSLREQLFGDGK